MTRRWVRRLVADGPQRSHRLADPLLAAAVRVVGDPRFYALDSGDLRPRWAATRYGRLR